MSSSKVSSLRCGPLWRQGAGSCHCCRPGMPVSAATASACQLHCPCRPVIRAASRHPRACPGCRSTSRPTQGTSVATPPRCSSSVPGWRRGRSGCSQGAIPRPVGGWVGGRAEGAVRAKGHWAEQLHFNRHPQILTSAPLSLSSVPPTRSIWC